MRTDTTLISACVAGDKKAFGQLVERHKKQAYLWALGLVGNKDDAYDISQEAFLRAYRSLDRFDRTRPFAPWFYAIVANLSRSWLRRRALQNRRSVDLDDVSYLLTTESTPEQEYARKALVGQLRAALMRLPYNDREIIVLQHFRNMSYDEIAELLGIPRGTVMSRLYYARKKLATEMRHCHA
ncbi:MAG TPA: RNA polymerase sigma factor [candidate division Zixibacteria bacterium]|nr:RNA polymerase sigma factor [candidate division Zixibacteria bacterium]MDD4918961.1 RNA polymerase sigma factor [candidate division Zixibacteria bacterium]MDM7973840.1 RNA polymerase sigma factor [candidate division Zixibacteria bacterium]HOD66390.1 RNA polymerase sigma factor [candidate division Zixibacteria bacterium]HPM36040.1 RNA polymerase sigma factor [candidate division Zixibacteria bacterium]